jgi:hypothetical protein
MTQELNDIGPLIQEIKTLAVTDKVKIGAVAILNIIPFAGGAIASVIGEIGTQRRFEKVCDVLADLNSELESHQVNPESHLSKDQIIEVVHETLQTAATASDEQKIAALKNGLGYVFLEDDSFERKQLLLQILRGCTSLELVALAALYDTSDPYVIREGGPPSSSDPLMSPYVVQSSSAIRLSGSLGDWRPMSNRDDYSKATLLKFLADQIQLDEGATEGALRLLDGKGLASAGPNLQRRDCKVLQWRPSNSMSISTTDGLMFPINEVRDTPLETSRTDFGRVFLSFCRYR